jgi:hypothetical protein
MPAVPRSIAKNVLFVLSKPQLRVSKNPFPLYPSLIPSRS